MGKVEVGHLYRKKIIRRLDGSIHTLQDDTLGGMIIRNGVVVNQEAVNILAAQEEDRRTAATEATQVHVAPQVAEERVIAPSKMEALEKKVADQDTKLDAILELLKKK